MKALFVVVTLAIVFGLLELPAWPALVLLEKDSRFDFRPLGLRGRREYSSKAAADAVRVGAFGDSFVFGSEVGNDDVWSAQAERSEPGLEVLNYGVGGYGTDQALMLYRSRGQELEPGSRRVLADPRLALEAGTDDELVTLVQSFAREVESAGDSFIFVIFPGRAEDIWSSARRPYAPLIEALPEITILDLADPLRLDPELTPATLLARGGHYSPGANRATGRALIALLRARGLLPPVDAGLDPHAD